MAELALNLSNSPVIKVIGVGGGGGNALQHMASTCTENVEYICANTDAQALSKMNDCTVIQLGYPITQGLGAGANPEIGRQAALEERLHLTDMLFGADMVFITAGMGGGTGTGAAPVIAEAAKELGILTVAVVTKPFMFEGEKRMKIATEGIRLLEKSVDSLIVIPNEKLMHVLGKDCTLLAAFSAVNDVLRDAVKGISDLITRAGVINIDFSDVRSVMQTKGVAMMGTGVAKGRDRASVATDLAIHSPLLEDINLKGANGILVNVTAGQNLSLGEFSDVGNLVEKYASKDTTVVVGTVIDPELEDILRVTVVVTGISLEAVEQVSYKEESKAGVTKGYSRAIRRNRNSELDIATQNNIMALDVIDIPSLLRR